MNNYDVLYPLNHQQEHRYVAAKGNVFVDEDGREFVDLDDMCVVLGQGNEAFTDCMCRALHGITSLKLGFSQPKQRLQQYMLDTTGGAFRSIHLTSSGSEAAEWAVKLARKITGRTEVISFWNSIHGRTQLSASMSGLPKRKVGFGPLDPGIVFAQYCSMREAPAGMSEQEYIRLCIDRLEQKYKYESAQDAACIIVESVQGGGVIVPPDGFLKALYDWAKSHGMLFILDEVQMGMGRTGTMYRYLTQGFTPDMLLLGKALGNGLHISALLMREQPPEEALPALSGGVGDDVLACTAACEVYRQLEDGLLGHVAAMGAVVRESLDALRGREDVYDVRCAGLAAAVEYDTDAHCSEALARVRAAGYMPGRFGKSIYIKPPYTVTEAQLRGFAALL